MPGAGAPKHGFVARWQSADFSRFTRRSRNVLAAAGRMATGAGVEVIGAEHLTAGLHNYIGTERLLLGILLTDGDAARRLTGLGLTPQQAEQKLADEFVAIQARRRVSGCGAPGRVTRVKALVSWEDANGATHRFRIAYDPDDAEARYFLEGLELHVRFRLETFDAEGDAAPVRGRLEPP